MARPTALTKEVHDLIVDAIRLGNYQDYAANAAGITVTTFYNWMDRGKRERERLMNADEKPNPKEAIFLEFFEAVEKAKGLAIAQNVAVIQRAAATGTWQAAAWWLERTAQKTYGRKQQLEHSGNAENPIALSVDVNELENKVKRILGSRGE
jgi:transposase